MLKKQPSKRRLSEIEAAQSDEEKRQVSLSALEIQRRLELKEFFLNRNDRLSAALVDNMFNLASFDEVKHQVQRLHGDVPENWKSTDRYEKYKEMLGKGMSRKKVQEQMLKDGLDPEELAWDDESKKQLKIRLSKCKNEDERDRLLKTEIKNDGGVKKHTFRGSKVSTFRAKDSEEKLIPPDLEDFELEQRISHIKKVSSKKSNSSGESGENLARARPYRQKKKPTFRKHNEVIVAARKRLASLNSSGDLKIKMIPAEALEKRETASEPNLRDQNAVSSVSKAKNDLDIKINPLHRSQFLYSSEEVVREKLGDQTKKSKTVEQREISKLAKKNKIGHIHDFLPFFAKSGEAIRKTSVHNISRKVSSIIGEKGKRDPVERERARSLSANGGSIVFPQDVENPLEEDLAELFLEDQEDEEQLPPKLPKVAPLPPPRRNRSVYPIARSHDSELESSESMPPPPPF